MSDDIHTSSRAVVHLDTPWTRLSEYVDNWLEHSEVIGANEDGDEGDVSLTERDEWMREDAVQGLLADEEFLDLAVEARWYTRMQHLKDGVCEFCGAPPPNHWGSRCERVAAALAPGWVRWKPGISNKPAPGAYWATVKGIHTNWTGPIHTDSHYWEVDLVLAYLPVRLPEMYDASTGTAAVTTNG